LWAGSVAANGQKVLDGLQWEIDRLATQTLADERTSALELRAKAQKKLDNTTRLQDVRSCRSCAR
jgi:hypothetical protein